MAKNLVKIKWNFKTKNKMIFDESHQKGRK